MSKGEKKPTEIFIVKNVWTHEIVSAWTTRAAAEEAAAEDHDVKETTLFHAADALDGVVVRGAFWSTRCRNCGTAYVGKSVEIAIPESCECGCVEFIGARVYDKRPLLSDVDRTLCPTCGGDGRRWDDESERFAIDRSGWRCESCDGSGRVS